ncbi:uncharacterized protein CDAR_232841 [Caerostris darwini]|uniref:Uncharacterized protein n=1 Tax=Caerostris darwini TaxID=1538125 RepID=A0AAV4Q957_9ARAC|nr:hypothetical protein CDAR_224301 [Caerostris darwini]GIY59452.1 uncharacterized protein CDAR_232841 [Caerostris darwini]
MACQWKVVLFAAFLMSVFGTNVATRDKRQSDEEMPSEIEKIMEDTDHPDFIFAHWNHTDKKLAQSIEQMMKKLMPMVIRGSSSVELSGPCMGAMFKMMMGMRQGKLWPFLSKEHTIKFKVLSI